MTSGRATKKELREFGLVVGAAFTIVGLLLWWRHGVQPWVFFGITGFLVIFGLVAPEILRPFQWFWMKLAHMLGWVMNRVLLGAIFYVVFTLVATVMRMIGRDTMHRKIDREAPSYWHLRTDGPPPKERYERQF